jgi:hypothetical protein
MSTDVMHKLTAGLIRSVRTLTSRGVFSFPAMESEANGASAELSEVKIHD